MILTLTPRYVGAGERHKGLVVSSRFTRSRKTQAGNRQAAAYRPTWRKVETPRHQLAQGPRFLGPAHPRFHLRVPLNVRIQSSRSFSFIPISPQYIHSPNRFPKPPITSSHPRADLPTPMNRSIVAPHSFPDHGPSKKSRDPTPNPIRFKITSVIRSART